MKQIMTFLLVLSTNGAVLSQENKLDPHDWLRIGISGSINAGMSLFQNGGFMHPSVNLTPLIVPSGGVLFNKELNQKYRVEFGLGVHPLGFRKVITTHYQANKKHENQNVETSSFSILKLPLIGQYYFQNDNKKFYSTFFSAGIVFMVNPTSSFVGSGSNGRTDPFNGEIISEVLRRETTEFTRVMASFGVGVERRLNHGALTSMRINYNLGFSELASWDYQINVGTDTFDNTIVNKGSNIEIQLAFFFSPISFKKRMEQIRSISN